MKRIFIILLTLCFVFSFSLTSYADYFTNEYEIVFRTKDSYENTEYEELFSDHRNFLNPEILGIPGISSICIFGASYSKNAGCNLPCYVLCARIGFGALQEASEICRELTNRGIAQWAVVARLGRFSSCEKVLEAYLGSVLYFTEFSADTFGDIDCNKVVSAEDARTALRIAVEIETGNDYPYLMGDMDYDGKITSADARAILRASVGIF